MSRRLWVSTHDTLKTAMRYGTQVHRSHVAARRESSQVLCIINHLLLLHYQLLPPHPLPLTPPPRAPRC